MFASASMLDFRSSIRLLTFAFSSSSSQKLCFSSSSFSYSCTYTTKSTDHFDVIGYSVARKIGSWKTVRKIIKSTNDQKTMRTYNEKLIITKIIFFSN